MLSGAVSLEDLPEAFDEKMREYLGLQPPDIVHGVLQDVHWSDVSFGYFPTYALGNVVSVQLWERAREDLGELEPRFERGEFAPLREWLGEHVHRHGRAFTPQELLQRVTGSPIDAGAVSRLPRAEARGAVRRRRRLSAGPQAAQWPCDSQLQTRCAERRALEREPAAGACRRQHAGLTSSARMRVAQRRAYAMRSGPRHDRTSIGRKAGSVYSFSMPLR